MSTFVRIRMPSHLNQFFSQDAQCRGMFARIVGVVREIFGQPAEDGNSLVEGIPGFLGLVADLIDPSHGNVGNSSLEPYGRLVRLVLAEGGQKSERPLRLPLLQLGNLQLA